MSIFFGTYQALTNAYQQVDNVTPRDTDGMEMAVKDRPDGMWLRISIVPTNTTPITLGLQGEDESKTTLQIDILYPKNKGVKVPYEKADEFASYFTAGKGLVYNNAEVKVINATLSPQYEVDGYIVYTLMVYTYTRYNRS